MAKAMLEIEIDEGYIAELVFFGAHFGGPFYFI